MAQVFFAICCDLMRDSLLPQKSSIFPDVGSSSVFVPSLDLNVSFLENGRVERQFCTEEVAAATKEVRKIGKTKWKAAGGQWHRPCRSSAASIASQFDLVLVSIGRQYQRLPKTIRTYVDDIRLTVQEFERAARKDARKIFLLLDNSAQHFRSYGMTGAYEDRALELESMLEPQSVNSALPTGEAPRPDSGIFEACYCSPSIWGLEWKNKMLAAELRNSTSHVRYFPFYNLTQPRWDMHVAHATQQHGSGQNGTRRHVCDCTHFCCPYWRLEHAASSLIESVLTLVTCVRRRQSLLVKVVLPCGRDIDPIGPRVTTRMIKNRITRTRMTPLSGYF